MTVYDPDDQLILTDCLLNGRDIGGMPLTDGRTTVRGRFIRSGCPDIVSSEAHDRLKELGVKTVIDLRSAAELAHYGNSFMDDKDVDFRHISLFLGDPDAENDPTMAFLRDHTLGDFYVILLEELKTDVAKVLRVLIENDGGIVLFHCAHGKDRTGVIAALLYLLAGAGYEDIVTNYKISYEYAKSFLDPLIEKREPVMRHTLRSDEGNMRTFLDYIGSKYGGDVRIYMRSAGLTDDEINRLYLRLTADQTTDTVI